MRGPAVAEFHEEEQRLALKVVYYGPALSGMTTNHQPTAVTGRKGNKRCRSIEAL